MVAPKRRIITHGVDELEASRWTGSHGHGNRSIQLNNSRRRHFREFGVESRDPCPVGIFGSGGPRMAGGDRRLDRLGAALQAQVLGPIKRRKSSVDQ
jgi:hypothetical protein